MSAFLSSLLRSISGEQANTRDGEAHLWGPSGEAVVAASVPWLKVDPKSNDTKVR
jgi:hypothetical protein